MADPARMRLYDQTGRRLYLNPSERRRFMALAQEQSRAVEALCLTLAHTGCRVSEALALCPSHLQSEDGVVAIRSLKKRQPGHIRELPIPPDLVERLDALASLNRRYWPIDRATAWR